MGSTGSGNSETLFFGDTQTYNVPIDLYELTRSPDLDSKPHDSFSNLCPIFGQTKECKEKHIVKPLVPRPKIVQGATDPALEMDDEISTDITSETNVKAPVKRKLPVMKSNWMSLHKTIPKFEIDEETFKNMVFRENLLISKLDKHDSYPIPVGALSLDIQSARGGPLRYQKEKTKTDYHQPKFLVHLSSQFDCRGHNGGSRIMAWVDRNLQTLEETRKEFIQKEEGVDKMNLYVNSQPDFYYLRHNGSKEEYYSPEKAKNLICEGASFLLMRYLAIKRFIGSFEVCTVYINGDLCRNIYASKGPQSGIVYGEKLDLCKIERTVIEKCGIERKSITLMTLGGRIMKHEWFNCEYILQINPQIAPLADKPSPLERIPLEKTFDTDLQLLSMFLDAKTANKKKIDSYMNDHPEIKNFVADYVNTILQLKPQNVFEFTAQYFLGFAPQLLPFTEYFEPPTRDDDDDDELNFDSYL